MDDEYLTDGEDLPEIGDFAAFRPQQRIEDDEEELGFNRDWKREDSEDAEHVPGAGGGGEAPVVAGGDGEANEEVLAPRGDRGPEAFQARRRGPEVERQREALALQRAAEDVKEGRLSLKQTIAWIIVALLFIAMQNYV